MAIVPESRRDQGLMLERSLLENTSLPYLKKFAKNINLKKFKNVDHIHFFGY